VSPAGHAVAWLAALVIAVGVVPHASVAAALPTVVGDLDGNSLVTVADVVRLLDHVHGAPPLPADLAPFGDLDQDGSIGSQDVAIAVDLVLGRTDLPPAATRLTSSPAAGEGDVAVSRETILRFGRPLAMGVTPTALDVHADFGDMPVEQQLHLSEDRRTLTVFYHRRLPASARVRVTVNGANLLDAFGEPVDVDGDGTPGGTALLDFDTLSLTSILGTVAFGRVLASDRDTQAGVSVDTPLAGVNVTVDGAEAEMHATTDANGNFRLDPAPAGPFFVHIRGGTATNAHPQGSYYPDVGKLWTAQAGVETSVGDVFLPLIAAGTLQVLSANQATTVAFPPSVLSKFPGFAGTQITIPPGDAYADTGETGGLAGIAPVPPDRLPGKLPEGLEFPLVITVQTQGFENFDTPVPACFPNLPDPTTGETLPPGGKTALWSYNHDTGSWEVIGPMTVTADGSLACTDAGVGIRAPGWHGVRDPPPYMPLPGPSCPLPPPPAAQAMSSAAASADGPNGGENVPATDPPAPPCSSNPECKPPPCGSECFIQCVADYNIRFDGAHEAFKRADDLCLTIIDEEVKHLCRQDAFRTYCREHKIILEIRACCLQMCQCTPPASPPSPNLAGAQPADPVADEIEALLELIAELLAPYTQSDPIPDEILAQVQQLSDQVDAAAGGDAVAYLRARQLAAEADLAVLEAQVGQLPGLAPPYPVIFEAEISRPAGLMQLRGRTTALGQYVLFVPRDGVLQVVRFYDPRSHGYGEIVPRLRPEAQHRLPNFYLVPITGMFDADGDGLPDLVETVCGTDATNPDTDGDAVSDGAELDQGTDPLDGLAVRTGIIAAAGTPGPAIDVAASNSLAVVAEGSAGISVFNVFAGMNPVAIAQVDTPGTAQRVALDGTFVVVADGPQGLAVIDISDPPAARIVREPSLGSAVRAVVASGGMAWAGLANGDVVSLDLASGRVLHRIALGEPVEDLALGGDFAYALTATSLVVMDTSGGRLTKTGSAASPYATTPNRRLFVGGGIAYAVHGKGYNTFDLGAPASPRILAAGNTTQFGWKQLVANGSGLGLAAVGPNSSDDGPHDISLYDVSDPRQVDAFLTTFPMLGIARAVSIDNALAYVADDVQGLQVVNYLAYDSHHVAPTIALSTSAASGSIEEGSLVRLTAAVSDDVQVRNVTFSLDGATVATDGNFPFELRLRAPPVAQQASMVLRARATDTGGNSTLSSELTLTITPDVTSPHVVAFAPRAAVIVGQVATLTAMFSEPMASATITASTFRVFAAGADGLSGTPDDVLIAGAVNLAADTLTATLMPSAPLGAGHFRAVVTTGATDLAGNAFAADFAWTFRSLGLPDGDGDGVPDATEATLGLDPDDADTDGDGIPDGEEDFDGDGLSNGGEALLGTNPANVDTDGDGIHDGDEDSDLDGLTDGDEMRDATDPLAADSDGDGWIDGWEVGLGSDPRDAMSRPALAVLSSAVDIVRPDATGSPELPPNTTTAEPPVEVHPQ
jgi:hypothetical protein